MPLQIRLKLDASQYLSGEHADDKSGDNSGNQKCRCIIQQAGVFDDDSGYNQLSDVVGDTSGNADTQDAETGLF